MPAAPRAQALSMGIVLAVAVAAGSLALGGPMQVSVAGDGHAPKINTHWNYSVRLTVSGKPARGRLTALLVDPIGGKHVVEFGKSSKKVLRWPFNGTFRDFLVFPASARGIPLVFRITVVSGGKTRVVNYPIAPHG